MFKLMSVTILFLFFTNLDFFWIWYLQHLPKKLGEEHVFYCYLFSYNNKDWQIEDTNFLSLVGGIISHYYLELGRYLETHYASWIGVEGFFFGGGNDFPWNTRWSLMTMIRSYCFKWLRNWSQFLWMQHGLSNLKQKVILLDKLHCNSKLPRWLKGAAVFQRRVLSGSHQLSIIFEIGKNFCSSDEKWGPKFFHFKQFVIFSYGNYKHKGITLITWYYLFNTLHQTHEIFSPPALRLIGARVHLELYRTVGPC